MKKIFLLFIMSTFFLSCCDFETEKYKETGVVIDEPPHRSYSSVILRLNDYTGNWSKTVNFNKLKLRYTNKNWEEESNNYSNSLLKIVKNSDSSTVEGLQVDLIFKENNYSFFKLNRNENTEDRIIAFYEDLSEKECGCIGKKLVKIIYNGKEYFIENKHIVHRFEEHEIPTIDIVVE